MNVKTNTNDSAIKTILHTLAGIVIMLLGDLVVSILFDFIFQTMPTDFIPSWAKILLRSVATIIATYGLLFVYVKKVLHKTLTDFRVGKIKMSLLSVVCAIVLPLFVIVCFIATGGKLFYSGANEKTLSIIMIAFSFAIKAGIVEEIIFRGYIMKLLEAKWNKYTAVFVPSLIFGLLHLSSMKEFNLISLLLLIVAGTSVGVMFSIVAFQNNSVWPSALIHMVWNACMISNILLIYPGSTGDSSAIFSIALSTQAPLITGGGFGVEASLFSIIGYLLVCLIAVVLKPGKKGKKK